MFITRNPITHPYLRAPEDSEGGGGGGGGADPSGGGDPGDEGGQQQTESFTQKQVNSIIAKERKTLTEKIRGEFTSKLDEYKQGYEELQAKLEEIEKEKALHGKDDKEKELIELRQRFDKLEKNSSTTAKQLEEARAEKERLAVQIRTNEIHKRLAPALGKKGALAEYLDDAIEKMMSMGSPELDDDGDLTITIDGKSFTSAEDAAEEFLRLKPIFAKAPASGPSPTGRPNGGRLTSKDLEDMSPKDLIAAELNQRR